MKVKLEVNDVLEVTCGEGKQELVLRLDTTQRPTHSILHAYFTDGKKPGGAQYTLSANTEGERCLTLFSHYGAIGEES